MAIINRSLGRSEKQHEINANLGLVAAGVTLPLSVVPFNSNLTAAQLTATGLSGAPNYSLWCSRLVAGVGVTAFNVGASLVAANFGVSGGQTFVVPAESATLLAGDVLFLNSVGANTASYAAVMLVLKAIDDIRNTLGAA